MTEVHVALTAFASELNKQLGSLLPPPQRHQHDLVKEHHRRTCKLQELINYYVKKLPPYACGPRLLAAGAELVSRHEYDLAIYCFGQLAGLNLPAAGELSKLDAQAKVSLHVQALCGVHSSQAAKAYQQDPHVTHADTQQAAKAALEGLQTACMQAVPHVQLYWLVYDATVHLHAVAAPLVTAGFHQEALPHYTFAAKALESHLQLSGTQYLPWRSQVYAAAVHCYCAVLHGSADSSAAVAPAATASKAASNSNSSLADCATPSSDAHQLLQDGLSDINSIISAQALDPVPPPAVVTTALQAARSHLLLLKVLVDAAAASTAVSDTQQPCSKEYILETLKPFDTEEAKLTAVLGLLLAGISSSQQPLQQRQLPPKLQPILNAAVELAKPLLELSSSAREDSISNTNADNEGGAGVSRAQAISEHLHISLIRIAYTYNQKDLLQELFGAAQVRLSTRNLDDGENHSCLGALAAVLEHAQQLEHGAGEASLRLLATYLKQHSKPLAAQLPGLVAAAAVKLHAAAEQLLQGCFSQSDGQSDTVLLVLDGLHEALQQCGCDDGVLRGCVAIRLALLLEQRGELHHARLVIQQGLEAVDAARCDALSQLKGAPDEHLRWITGSCIQANQATATLVAGMTPTEQELACIHADALLVQQRLELSAGLQEVCAETAAKQQQMVASTIRRDKQSKIFGTRTMKEKRMDELAIEVAGRTPSNAAVCERHLVQSCGKNSYQKALLLTQIAAYQPDVVRQAALLQEACDLLEAAHSSEAELLAKQQPSAATQTTNSHHSGLLPPKILCRTPNSIMLTNFPVSVRGYKQPVAFAAYCKPTGAGVGLSINSTAMEYPGSGVKVPLGSRVMIEGLQSNATYIFAIAVHDERGELIGDLGPSTPSITLALPLPLYSCWAHVLLTAAQLHHWEVARRAASIVLPRFILTGPAKPLWQENPMDRHRLQLQQVAAAPAPLLRLLVLAVYSYAGQQGQKLYEQLLCMNGLKQGGSAAAGDAGAAGKLAGTAASRALLLQCSESQVPGQVALLETSKMIIAAMQIGGVIGDEMLVEEGAVRAYNLLQPLLQQRDITPLMQQALSSIHMALTAVKDVAPSSIKGHSEQRKTGARATAAVSYWLMRLSAPFHPDLTAGAVAGAVGGVQGKALQPAAAFARLDCALLKALGPPSAPEGQAPEVAVTASGKLTARASGVGTAAKASKGGKQQLAAVAVTAGAAVAGTVVLSADTGSIEMTAAQDLALLHPDSAAWGLPARLQDPLDLPGQVLAKLNHPDALANCWPLLSGDAACSHMRWLPLCVMVLEAAAKQHGKALLLAMSTSKTAGPLGVNLGLGLAADTLAALKISGGPKLLAAAAAASELVVAVTQHVRLAARVPQLLEWSTDPCWTVEAADAALASSGYVLGAQGTAAEPRAPQFPPGIPEVDRAAAVAKWEQEKADLLVKERKRLAAALFLQQRLPVLLKRRRMMMQNRQQLVEWAPWLARLHSLLAGLAAEAAATLAAFAAPAATSSIAYAASEAEDDDDGCEPPGTAANSEVAERPEATDQDSSSATALRLDTSATKQGTGSTSRSTGSTGKGPGGKNDKGEGASATELMQQLSIQALQQFAQAATVAARAGPDAWQELFNSCKQLWNTSRFLINKQPCLTLPTTAVAWVQGLLPAPKVPPLAAEAAPQVLSAAVDAAAAKGKTAAGDKKAGDKSGAVPGEKKGAGAGTGGKGSKVAVPEVPTRQTLVPKLRGASAADTLSAVAEAVLVVLHQLRTGAAFHSKVVPLIPTTTAGASSTAGSAAVSTDAAATQTGKKTLSGDSRPVSARSHATSAAATDFSLGSDAVVTRWHEGVPIDVEGLTRLILLVLKVLHKMERWHKIMDIGCRWLDVCEGSADASLLPWLLNVAPKVGNPAQVAMLTTAHQALLRDKNTAFDALDKVRAMVCDRLTQRPLLSQQTGSTHKPARKPNAAAKPGAKTSHSTHLMPAAGGLGPEPSGFSVASTKSKRAVADQVLLPAEYEKVVEQLSKRGEKGHMILALTELGDVHAHFGIWPAAEDAWGGALDALLGPYQVVRNWTTKLTLGSWQELLARYGAHGLLLAGTLLGKLARYIYPCHLNNRLSCARLAAELLPAVFAADIIHPQRAVDCAMYAPMEIRPGMDLFDDPYRCNAPDLLLCLETLAAILLEHHLCLQLLPLISLWEHLALHVVHRTSSVLLARITRVKALAQLGLLAEAGVVLQSIMQGRNLPGALLHGPQPLLGPDGADIALQEGHSTTAAVPNSKAAAAADAPAAGNAAGRPHFDSSKWPGHASNAAFLESMCTSTLQPCIAEAYGSWICGQLVLARAAWLAAAGGVANCWRATDPASLALGGSSTGSSTSTDTISSNSSSGHHAAAVASRDATAALVSITAMDAVEAHLLDRAAELVQEVVATSRKAAGLQALPGAFSWDHDSDAAADAASSKKSTSSAKGGKAGKAAAGAKGKAGKGAAKHATAAATSSAGGSDEPVGMEQVLLQQQHQQLVAEGLMLLTQVELLKWMPSQALQLSIAAASVVVNTTSAADGSKYSADSNQHGSHTFVATAVAADMRRGDADRTVMKPSTWLASRCQLATVLLHLKHYKACVAVASKGLTDSSRVGDVLWGAQLQQVKANALAAQGDAAEALNVMREALGRLQQLSLSGPLLLSLQLDCAVLCDELGARGEVDNMATAALATSSTVSEQAGLQEMLEHAELLNLYLTSTPTHVRTLLLAATNATRRRQLATAEKLLRQATVLLGCMRSLPTQHAEVAMQLAQVLKLQAALKLPATDLVVNRSSGIAAAAAARAEPPVEQAAAVAPGPAGSASVTALRQRLELQQQRLQEAAELLMQVVKLVVTDCGSHPQTVRAALLELAAVELHRYQLQDGPGNAATQGTDSTLSSSTVALGGVLTALQAAHVTAGHIRVLYLTSYQLQPVNSPASNLPGWLLGWLRGQEHLQVTLQQQSASVAATAAAAAGKSHNSKSPKRGHQHQVQDQAVAADSTAADATPVSDATLGRLAVCHYVLQLTAAAAGLAGLEQRQICAAQAMHTQLALSSACPKMLTDCCWTQMPALGGVSSNAAGGPAANPSSGAVYLQWHRQSCCWQVPGSWCSDGCLPPASRNTHITRDILHQLPPPPAYASCIYVVNAQAAATAADEQQQTQRNGLLVGEVVVSLERLKRLQLQCKTLRRRLEAPGLPTDVFGAGAPSVKELAAAKHGVEGMLAGISEEDLGPAPVELPPTPAAAAVPNSTPGAAKPVAATIGKTAGGAGGHAGPKQQAGGAASVTATGAETAPLDWISVSTWMKVEALLDVEDGAHCVDWGLAAWLAEALQQEQTTAGNGERPVIA